MMGTLTIMDLIVLRALLLVGITTALSAVRIEDLPVTNEPVIIPGQCDTVAGKAEFDMMRVRMLSIKLGGFLHNCNL